MPLYCLCGDTLVDRLTECGRSALMSSLDVPHVKVYLTEPMLCIKTGAEQIDARQNVDLFECKHCGTRVAKE